MYYSFIKKMKKSICTIRVVALFLLDFKRLKKKKKGLNPSQLRKFLRSGAIDFIGLRFKN